MSGQSRTLAAGAVAYRALGDFVPLYAVYALLFRDHGISAAGVSALFAIWSLTAFILEVPSGAWADTVSRRGLLLAGSLLTAAGFALWLVVPSFPGFAAGFVLWGAGGALMSGTYEALLYDGLALRGDAPRYASVLGWADSASVVGQLVATALATPLFAVGGYVLVGWASVLFAVAQALVALTLPAAPRVAVVSEPGPRRDGIVRRYVAMLRAGLRESLRHGPVRHSVLVVALLMGLLAADEYMALVARDMGIPTVQIPLFMALAVGGYAVGAALAGRTARLRVRFVALLLGGGALLLVMGALTARPLGFVAIAAGYGLAGNVLVVTEARLQEAIDGPARATVTSVSGLLSELTALAVFGVFAAGAARWTTAALFAAVSVPLLLIAVVMPRWLVRHPEEPEVDTAG